MCKNSNTSCLLQITLETLKTTLKDDDAFLSFINKPTAPKSYTALHYVSANCTINEIKTLLSFGADPNAITIDGFNLLHCACMGCNLRNVIYIIEELKFDINTKDNMGSDALHWSVFCNFRKGVDYLLSKGSNVNSIDNNEMTPLHVALMQDENNDLIELLTFYKEINLNKKDIYRRSYEDIASVLENENFITIFKQAKRQKMYITLYILFCSILLCIDLFEFFGFVPYKNTTNKNNNWFSENLFNIYGYILLGICCIEILFVSLMMICDKRNNRTNKVNININNSLLPSDHGCNIINNTDEYLNSYCFFCKTIKNNNETTIHCMRCNKCIDGQIRHSCFYHKCITKTNRLFLFIIYLLTLIHLIYVCVLVVLVYNKQEKPRNLPTWMDFIYNQTVQCIAKIFVLSFGVVAIIVLICNIMWECKENNVRKINRNEHENVKKHDNNINKHFL